MSEMPTERRKIICGNTQHPLNILEMIFNRKKYLDYSIYRHISQKQEEYSLISDSPDILATCNEKFEGVKTDSREAYDDEVLKDHGINTASAIIISYNDDRENLLTTLSTRQLNPTIRIVVICSMVETMRPKLIRAGANSVISRSNTSGLRMASQLVRPNVTELLDLFFLKSEPNFSAEEIVITEHDSNNGVTISESEYPKKDLLIVAISRDDTDNITYNPSKKYKLRLGDILLVIGKEDNFNSLSSNSKYHSINSALDELN